MYDLFSEFLFNGFDVTPQFREIKTCPKCGRSFQDFQRTGKLGCGECYETFYSSLQSTIKQMQGVSGHTGKIPSKSCDELKRKRMYESLKKELSKAVAEENYEEAARLYKIIEGYN